MKKVLLYLIFILISPTYCQDCNNPLLKTYNLTANLTTVTGATNCPKFNGQLSCCDASTLNGVQSFITNITNTVLLLNIQRDIKSTRLRYKIDAFFLALNKFSKAFANLTITNSTYASSIAIFVESNINYFTSIGESITSLGSPDLSIQIERNKCQLAMLKQFAALKCLACDPYYASKGVSSSGAVSFSSHSCGRISRACYSYVQASYNFSRYFMISQSADWLNAATTQIKNIAAGNATAINETALPLYTPDSTNITDYPTLANICTNISYCEFVCNDGGFIKSGLGDINALVIGGNKQTSFSRLLQSVGAGGGLGNGSFDPDENEANVTIVLTTTITIINLSSIFCIMNIMLVNLFFMFMIIL